MQTSMSARARTHASMVGFVRTGHQATSVRVVTVVGLVPSARQVSQVVKSLHRNAIFYLRRGIVQTSNNTAVKIEMAWLALLR